MSLTEPPAPPPSASSTTYPFGAPSRFSLQNGLPGDGGPNHRDPSLRDLVRRLARWRWLMLGAAGAVATIVTAWALIATPRYRSEARLRIESKSQSQSLSDQVSSSMPGASLLGIIRDELETEVAVLRSDRIIDATIDSLALGVRVTTPAASRAAVLTAQVIDPNIDEDGSLTLQREAGGRYRAERHKLEDVTTLPAVLTPGAPVRVGGTVISLAPQLASSGPSKIVVKFVPRYKVHKLLDKRLRIARQEGGSRLVEVSYQDPDRALAAQVVNRMVAEFVEYTNLVERVTDTTTVSRLRVEVADARRKLGESEVALRAFEERSRLIVPEEQASAQVKRISLISMKVDEISVERNALARMLAIIEERSQAGGGAASYRQLTTFPSLITNRAIQDLLQALLDLENKRSLLGVRRTENNEEYKQVSDRIAEIESQLYQLGTQYLESLDQQLATTAHAVTALTDTLEAMPAAAMQYGRLVRDRTVDETIHLALEKQLKLAEVTDVLRQQRIRVVDAPRVANADDYAFPKKAVMIPLGIVLGIVLAVTLALIAELWTERPYLGA
jgi:uncharacterized protein involved in exopolysaccharide biosynthesis